MFLFQMSVRNELLQSIYLEAGHQQQNKSEKTLQKHNMHWSIRTPNDFH